MLPIQLVRRRELDRALERGRGSTVERAVAQFPAFRRVRRLLRQPINELGPGHICFGARAGLCYSFVLPTADPNRLMLRGRRYSIVIADRRHGAVRHLTIALWPALATVLGVLALPILIGLGARWSARATIDQLQGSNAALQVENASYREATGQLAEQISALQGAVNQLGEHAAVDPTASRAMERLPAIVKSRAMGGSAASAPRQMLSTALGSPDTVLGVLSDLLGVIGTRLESVRDSVERRHALAMATPSIWPVAGWLTSTFGTRKDPFSNGSDFHPGLDISADYGQPVLATGDATVVAAGMNGAYGNMVTLDHGFGITTKYGHLSRIMVRGGQQVKRGDLIGFVGSTGRSTGAHLHYEVWMNGRLTNPLTLLAH
jgi:murein DD-endopeptidase MepM/ murein hydrolase activator NlpD